MTIAKKILVIYLLLFCCVLYGDSAHWKEYAFNIRKRDYTLATSFQIEHDGVQFAEALKRKIRLRTQYDLFDAKGDFAGQSIYSWIPSYGLGWVYAWAADFYIYDKNGEYLGMIDGTLYTKESAKFTFYDFEDKCIAVAYMDSDRLSFSISDPENSELKIAELIRHRNKCQADYWSVHVFDEDAVPIEMIQAFAVFACDQQEYFLLDQ